MKTTELEKVHDLRCRSMLTPDDYYTQLQSVYRSSVKGYI